MQICTLMDETDRVLIAETLRGSRGSFERLVARYEGRVFGVVLARLGHRQDAEDVAQEVFLRAYRALGELDDADRFPAWLHGIARRAVADRQRRRRRERASLEELARRGALDRAAPGGLAAPENLEPVVLGLLSELDERARLALTLRLSEKRPYKEIAVFLDCPVSTVRGLIARGMQRLRGRLREVLGPDAPAPKESEGGGEA